MMLTGSMLVGYSNCSNFEAVSGLSLNSSGPEARRGGPLAFPGEARVSPYSQSILDSASGNASCAVSGDLDVSTHYKNGMGLSHGGKDPAPIFRDDLWGDIANRREHVRIFVNGFIPSVDNYLSSDYDHFKPDKASFEAAMKVLCHRGASSVIVTQPARPIASAADLRALIQPNVDAFQVIHAILFRKNLFSLYIPPNWSPDKQYALLFNSGYSLNSNATNYEGPVIGHILADAYAETGVGAVGMLWNGGASYNSFTFSDKPYRDLNDFMRIVVPTVGLHSQKGVAFGTSRGGVTALNVSSHPDIDQMRFALSYPTVPASDISFLGTLFSTTFPYLLSTMDYATGYAAAWRIGYRTPEGQTGIDKMFLSLVGTASRDQVDARNSLTADRKVSRLLANRTQVYFELSTHDGMVPTADQFRMLNKYRRSGVPLETRINYFVGHGGDNDARARFIRDAVIKLIPSTRPLTERLIQAGRTTYYDIETASGDIKTRASSTPNLMTMEVPRFFAPQAMAQVVTLAGSRKRFLTIWKDTLGRKFPLITNTSGDGEAVQDVTADLAGIISDTNSLELEKMFELDSGNRPLRRIFYETSDLGSETLQVSLYPGDLALESIEVHKHMTERTYGADFGRSVGKHATVAYGLLEASSRAALPVEELEITRLLASPTALLPAVYDCTVIRGALANFTMEGEIVPAREHVNQKGFFYVAGYDPNGKKWYSFDGQRWTMHDDLGGGISAIGGVDTLVPAGVRGRTFTNADLRAFPNGEIYLGYGLGTSLADSWKDLLDNNRYKLCTRLPAR